jgi:hypothetical protein
LKAATELGKSQAEKPAFFPEYSRKDIGMKGEKVWGKALELLRARVKRHVYDTWIRDTVGLDLKGDVLTVGVVNEYAREWLEKKCSHEIDQILEEILGEKVTVQFRLIPEDGVGGTSSSSDDDVGETLVLETRYLSAYEEIVKPERIIAIPRYYLRWIPWLGVDLAWLPIGFRQAAYLYGSRHEGGDIFEASAHDIARWSGMSVRTFWRKLNDPYLRWFVRKIEGETIFRWNEREGRLEKHPNRWQVVMSMPLTPADQVSLRCWMEERKESRLDPISILKGAIGTPVNDLLPWPDETPHPEEVGEPLSLWDIVAEIFNEDLGPEIQPALYQLANELTNRIKGRNLLVSHYFIEKWLPLLRPGPGWLVTLLRCRRYYNQKSEELRDEIWIAGGYGELASGLGLRRPKTVNEWLTGKGRDSQRLKNFFNLTGREKGSDQVVALLLKVHMEEPLTPEDHKMYENHILAGGQGAFDTMEKGGQGANGTMGKRGHGANGTMREGGHGANDTMGVGGSGREWHSLKDSLIKIPLNLKYLKDVKTTTLVEEIGSNNGNKDVVVLSWNLPKLFSHNRVDKTIRKVLIKGDTTAEIFVSWLLYGASARGKSIKDPVSHAVDRMRKEPRMGAGKAFETLAMMLPNDLACLVVRAVDGTAKWAGNSDWNNAMGGSSQGQLMDLAYQLGIDVGKGNNR